MKILQEKSREYQGTAYYKYKVNIPKGALDRAQMEAGDEVTVAAEAGEILLKKSAGRQEFDGERAKLYREALQEFPDARAQDIELMRQFLAPKRGERILEIGAGSGFFSKHIADAVGESGKLIVSDPSLDQLEDVKRLKRQNIEVIQFVQFGSETVDLERDNVDAVWSFGAMHHMIQKSKSFGNMHRILRKGGRVVIGDVFNGSKLAKHFDEQVAKYCISGHEVAFWNREYATTLCELNGFTNPVFHDIDIQWKFKSRKDIGAFLYKLHGMTKTTPAECRKGAEKILGVKKVGNEYCLQWPMTIFVTYKR